jgi:polysaccharide pyruvyl transferase WcaK-like protein
MLRRALGAIPGALPLVRSGRKAAGAAREIGAEAAFWPGRVRHLRALDLLIVAGSNQLSDYVGGPWAFPYTIGAWSGAARMAGTPVAFLSVGAGPIRAGLSRRLIRSALGWASFRSYRDVGSKGVIESLGVPGPHRIAPDLAHGLRLSLPPFAPRSSPGGPRTIVVNPLPYFDPRFWAESDRDAYRRYVDILAAFASERLARGDLVRFVPTQLRADPPVIADVVRALAERGVREGDPDRLHPAVGSFEDLIRVLSEADLVVATRFHGAVLAQMLGKPVVGIAYRRSTTDLLEDVGQGAYSIDASALTLERLRERVEALESDGGAGDRIARRVREYREAVDAQYDLVLGTRPAPHPGETAA